MGNCWALLRPSEDSCLKRAANSTKPDQKVLQVVKMDGKIEFRAPLLVKEVLLKFSGEGIDSSVAGTQQTGGVKRIKVVITKQELQRLLTKQIPLEEVLAGLEKRSDKFVVSPRNWKPKLESIYEENE